MTVMLTDKERQTRGLDALGTALRPLVDERMNRSTHGKPWVPLYEAKETVRLGGPYGADAKSPRIFEVTRLGANVRERLEGVLRAALAEHVLIERGGFLFTN